MRANYKWFRKTGRINYDWENIIPVNKSPHLINKIGYINKLFPGSKFIFIIRDIRGQSSSMKSFFNYIYETYRFKHIYIDDGKSCWSDFREDLIPESLKENPAYPTDFNTIPKMWMRLNSLILDATSELEKSQYLIISYEDLITDQASTLQRVFHFLNLEEKHRQEEVTIQKRVLKFKNTTTEGNPLQKWKKTLSKQEIQQIEKVVKHNIDQYNAVVDSIQR